MKDKVNEHKIPTQNIVSSDNFLLSEFNALQERTLELERIKSSRINFFLIVFAASIAGISGLINVSNLEYIFSVVLIGSFVLLLLGISTLRNITDYSMAIVTLYRKAGRIRRWFLDNDTRIEKYVAFEPNDDRPKMYIGTSVLSWRGGEPILIIANIVTASVCVGASLSFVSSLWSLIGIILTIPVSLKLQMWFFKKRLKKTRAYRTIEYKFPK